MTHPILDEAHIREAAYLLWLDEGQPQGRDQDHWSRAVDTLTAALEPSKPAPKAAAKARSPRAKATPKAAVKTVATKAKPAGKPKAAAPATASKPATPKSAAQPKTTTRKPRAKAAAKVDAS